MTHEPPAATIPTSHPKALYFIFWGEFAERACYYGMRAILSLYMIKCLNIEEANATSYYSLYKMACYMLPLLGGYIADRYIGKYWAIVGFSIPYVIGQSLLAYGDRDLLIFSLALLAFGSGVIKPNISSLLGMTYDQQRPGKLNLRAQAFLWFYFSINVGALISQFTLPLVRDYVQNHYSIKLAYQVAFAIPVIFMVGSLIAFAIGRPYYAVEKPGPGPKLTPEERSKQRKVITSLLGVFLLIVLFWIPYEHNDVQWIYFADKYMDLSTPWLSAHGGPEKISADAYQWINALGVLILLPFFAWFWPRFDPTGKRVSPIQKMFAGFLFTATGPLVMAVCAYFAQHGSSVSALWLVLAYFLLTIGEVLVYGTGLDFSYGQAPTSMKSMITACFLLTNAISNLFNSFWTRNYDNPDGVFPLPPLTFFSIDVVLPIIGGVLMLIVGRRFHQEHVTA
jgi:dipeptide/tripeptide permease